MGKEGRRFLPNLKKLGSPRLNFDERITQNSEENISRHKRDGQRTNGKLLPYGGR